MECLLNLLMVLFYLPMLLMEHFPLYLLIRLPYISPDGGSPPIVLLLRVEVGVSSSS